MALFGTSPSPALAASHSRETEVLNAQSKDKKDKKDDKSDEKQSKQEREYLKMKRFSEQEYQKDPGFRE